MTRPDISVVIPVWGDQHNLPRLLSSLRATLDDIGVSFEIIVSAGPSQTGLRRLVEFGAARFVEGDGPGYGSILRAGLRVTTGRYVITMDADFSHRPAYLRTMWSHRHKAEVLIGSRYVRGAYAEMGFLRSAFSRALNLFYRKTLSLEFRDVSSGFRMYHREVLDDVGLPEGDGLDVLPELLTKAICQGWQIAEVPFWYRGARPRTRAAMLRLGAGFLMTLGRVFGLRNSVKAADYDHRAFDSWIPLQRYWQRRRFKIIQTFALDGGRTLDIGCGSSRIIQTLPDVVGMDVAMKKLSWLRAQGRELVQGSLTNLPFRGAAFGTVICSEVIEHLPREAVRLEELLRVIEPGGTLVLGTPDYGRWIWPTIEWIYGRVFPGGYVSEHVNHYTYDSLRGQLEELGLEILDCRYVAGSQMIFKARVPATLPRSTEDVSTAV